MKVLDAVGVKTEHVGVSSVLHWQIYVPDILWVHNCSVLAGDAAFDGVKKCKSHVKKQIMLKYADMVVPDMVVPDMPMLSPFQQYVQNVSPGVLTHVIFCTLVSLMWCPSILPLVLSNKLMRVCWGCPSNTHEHTSCFARRHCHQW
jgi:hypothetical protein